MIPYLTAIVLCPRISSPWQKSILWFLELSEECLWGSVPV